MSEHDRASTGADYALRLLLGDDFERFRNDQKIVYQSPGASIPDAAALWIVASGFFGADYGTSRSLPVLPLREIEGIPLLYGTPEIRREGNRLIVHADIIASAFFLVTRYEETVRREVRDVHGRFPGKESLPCRCGFLDRPIVDEYAQLLRKWLREVGLIVPEPPRCFSAFLTHDIDNLRRYQAISDTAKMLGKAVLGRCALREIPIGLAVSFGFKRDPLDTFEEMIRLDTSLREKPTSAQSESLYFFMVRRSSYGGDYNIHGQAARSTIRKILGSGARIGLHASYDAGMRPELIAEEKRVLEEVCGFPIRHNRHDFLNWREVEHGWALADAGIECDYTLGYADVAGFRLGVCHPIPLFDPVKMEPFGIEEHPLIVMDVTLSGSKAMALGEEAAFDYSRRLIRQTAKHKGQFVMLWHNDRFAQRPGNYHPRLYRRLLEELANSSP
jgi:hypothetical protein